MLSFGPDIREQISRARNDLRMGVPILLRADQDALLIPTETLMDQRLNDLRKVSEEILLVLTAKRGLCYQQIRRQAFAGRRQKI